jgi:hypothetical protein
MQCSWKKNWDETREHFRSWWKHEGFLVGAWGGSPRSNPHEKAVKPEEKKSIEEQFTDMEWRAVSNHYGLAQSGFHLDSIPITCSNYGPGNLATFLGSEPDYSKETVWFNPTIMDDAKPEKLPPFKFDPENRWWKIVEATLRKNAEMGRGKYLTGCPDLVEQIDVLASLRDPQTLLVDMIERPEWVEEKVLEINQVWFEAYSRIYEIIKEEDGSSAFWAFCLWGDGKTAKVQCDTSAMFSSDMFKRFVVPALTEQCEWLDCSMFHLDGRQCIPHLYHLLEIDALDAIEWTPYPTVPTGGDSKWYEMYRRILNAGKSIQAIGIKHEEIKPLLDAVGSNGVYILTSIENEGDAEKIAKVIEPYR